jgi:hypothetical protein
MKRRNGNSSIPFNKLSPWYQKQLTSEAIKQARQKCVCAFNPRPDEQEAELFCAECVAVVNIVNPKASARRFAMVFARGDGKLVEPLTGAEFGE